MMPRHDGDEAIIAATRPIILNGIEDMIVRPDLADRSLVRQGRCVKILQATSDRRARKPCDFGNRSKTATPGSPRFGRRKQAPSPLVELRAEGLHRC